MSVASALAFIQAVRADITLADEIAALPAKAGAEAYCALAEGSSFDEADLAEAFRIDWTARWAHYSRKKSDEGVS